MHVLVADDASGLASQVTRAYREQDLWHRLSDAGVALCQRVYSVDAVTAEIRALLETLTIAPPDS